MKKYKNLLWIFFFLILLFGCANVPPSAPVADQGFLTPIPESTLLAYREGTPIANKVQAVIAARVMISNLARMESVQSPDVIFVERITLAEAKKKAANSSGESYGGISEDTPVWFVVFNGTWRFHPLDPEQTITPAPPFSGCQYVWIIESNNGYSSTGNIACED